MSDNDPTFDAPGGLELVHGRSEALETETVELCFNDEQGYHVRRVLVATRNCTVEGQAFETGDKAYSLVLADAPVFVLSEFPWEAVWDAIGPDTRLSGADATLQDELENFLTQQGLYLRKRLGRSIFSLLGRPEPRRKGEKPRSVVQLPDQIVRSPGIFSQPIRRPNKPPRSAAAVQVTFPHSIIGHLPVTADGRLLTLEPFDLSVYAVACTKWELLARSGEVPDQDLDHMEVPYSPWELCQWLGIPTESGGNSVLVKESMARLGAITWDVPVTGDPRGDHRLQFQLLERHRYEPDARWGTFELPSPITQAIRDGRTTRFPRETLNRLRRLGPTAVFLYGALVTHRGWEGHPSGNLEFVMGVDKLRTLVNRTDTNASRVRKDILEAAGAIAELDPTFSAPSLTKTGRGRWVFRILKARTPHSAPRVRAADQVRVQPERDELASPKEHDEALHEVLEKSTALPEQVREGILRGFHATLRSEEAS